MAVAGIQMQDAAGNLLVSQSKKKLGRLDYRFHFASWVGADAVSERNLHFALGSFFGPEAAADSFNFLAVYRPRSGGS